MKYEGRLMGLNLLTGRTRAENAHILARNLQGNFSPESKEVLFFSTCRKVFGGLYRVHSPTHPLWLALRQTGLIETLLQTLIKQEVRESEVMPREELDWGVSELVACLSIIVFCGCWKFDDDVQALVKQKLGTILDSIHSEYGLRSKSDPEQLYKIQCVAVTTIGHLLLEYKSDSSFQSSMNARQLAALALAVLFDPLGDSNKIDSMTTHLAHKYAINILLQVNASQDSGLYTEVAPLVANRFGAKRIVSKCSSYFANPRYFVRCCAGLGLCQAVAPAKAIQPRFINDGKLHLTILRWYWKAFRGPQEVPPEDVGSTHDHHDLTELSAGIICGLWSITHSLSPDLRKKLIYDAVVEGDLVILIGHWFLIPKNLDIQTAGCKNLMEEIVRHYGEDRQFVKVHVEPAWRHIFKSLNSAKRCGVQTWRDEGAQAWLPFGERLGLTPKKNEGPDSNDHVMVQSEPSFVKCNSIVCPLYGEPAFENLEPGISGLRCTKCQTVYCSLTCQKTDWISGRHQKICRTGSFSG
ncbi:hypothetical protein FRC01_005602 [Tulasnella sp. 417]|nr:hypothetical protein FRC01_005602 [Tulasnella sp. 417]